MNTQKFKTVLCKHYGQSGTCSYGDKCQFAHGFQELKNPTSSSMTMNLNTNNNMNMNNMMGMNTGQETTKKQPPNPSNFKIVKCKNYEQTGTCKYGSVCTFAHGDNELRTKSDNNLQMSENVIMDNGFNSMQMNPLLMQDPNLIWSLLLQQQSMMGGVDMSQMGGMDMNMLNNMNMIMNQNTDFNNYQMTNTNNNINDMNMNNNFNNNMYMGGDFKPQS